MVLAIVALLNFALLLSYFVNRKISGFHYSHIDVWMGVMLAAMFPTVFGINYYFIVGLELPWGLESHVRRGIVERVYVEYYVSWILLFIIMGVSRKFLVIPNNIVTVSGARGSYSKTIGGRRFGKVVVIVSLGLMIADLVAIGDLPLFHLARGDVVAASEAKASFFNARMSGGVPLIGYYIHYLPLFAFLWSFYAARNTGKYSLFIVMAAAIILYSIATFIKSYALVPIIGCVLLIIASKKRLDIILIFKSMFIFIAAILIPFYFFSLNSSFSDLISALLERVFLTQIEGAFLIRSIYQDWELSALMHGFPLIGRLGVSTLDPAQGILIQIWGEQALLDGFVNMNSHFSGQAFVMFDIFYLLIAPVIIAINFGLLTLTFRLFKRNDFCEMAFIIAFVCALYIPFNNNFSNAFYLKQVQAMVLLLAVLVPLYKATKPSSSSIFPLKAKRTVAGAD